jgi:hypothetical protein
MCPRGAGAWRIRGIPKWVDRKLYNQQITTAYEIVSGGTFRGSVVVYELISYVDGLSCRVPPRLRFKADHR